MELIITIWLVGWLLTLFITFLQEDLPPPDWVAIALVCFFLILLWPLFLMLAIVGDDE